MFTSADIATWVAFNYEHIDEQVLATTRVLDIHCVPQDNIGFYLHASKLFFAANDDERAGGIKICRHLAQPEWLPIFKEHEQKYKSQVPFNEFAQLFGELQFSKHSSLVRDQPVQEWISIIRTAKEAETIQAHLNPEDQILRCLYDQDQGISIDD